DLRLNADRGVPHQGKKLASGLRIGLDHVRSEASGATMRGWTPDPTSGSVPIHAGSHPRRGEIPLARSMEACRPMPEPPATQGPGRPRRTTTPAGTTPPRA